jgi:hypothetical protein
VIAHDLNDISGLDTIIHSCSTASSYWHRGDHECSVGGALLDPAHQDVGPDPAAAKAALPAKLHIAEAGGFDLALEGHGHIA